MPEEVKITIVADEKKLEIWTLKGKNIWEVLALAGLDVGGSCGGQGTCGKCKVQVLGNTSLPEAQEKELLLAEEIKTGVRLACHCLICEPLEVHMNFTGLTWSQKSLLYAVKEGGTKIDRVSNHKIFLPGLDELAPVPIYDRIGKAMPGCRLELKPDNIRQLAGWDRQGRPVLELNALVFYNQVVKCVHREIKPAYGVAFDLGSTSLMAALVDLRTGAVVEVTTHTNMQRIYGEDLIARISYSINQEDGLEKLHQILINNINAMLEDLCQRAAVETEQLYAGTVVGNPVMLHIFLNQSIYGFGTVPFFGTFCSSMEVVPTDLGIHLDGRATLYVLPQIGGFVGADTVGALLILPHLTKESFIFIDIGTNGEIVVGNGHQLWAASAAAGPAFEGGGLGCGMRAVQGAIDRVALSEEGQLIWHWLGDTGMRGLCGSGALDLLACLFSGGYVDARGIFTEKAWQCLAMEDGKNPGLVIADPELSNQHLLFTQEDIRQLQLAKSAVRTAVEILLDKAQLTVDDVDALYMAGSFGTYLNPISAKTVGIIPPIDDGKIINLGNAAGLGAVKALLSVSQQKYAEQIAKSVQHIELALQADFQSTFLQYIDF